MDKRLELNAKFYGDDNKSFQDDGNKALQLSLVKEDSDLAAEDFIWCLSSVKTLDLKMQSFGKSNLVE